MNSLLLLASSAVFAALFLLNSLIKALARREKVGFFDTLLAYAVTLVALAALIANALEATPDAVLPTGALILAGGVFGLSLLVVLIEVFRPQRLHGSRGILGLFSGALIALASLGVPFAGAYFSLLESAPVPSIAQAATRTATSVSNAESTAEPTEASGRNINDLFKAIREVLADEIDADEVEVFTQIDAGVPLAEIVEANGGDIERVIGRLTTLMQNALRESVAAGEMNALQGALFISQMETFIRIAVNSDLNTFGSRFGETPASGSPTATRRSLLALLTESPTPDQSGTPAPETTPSATDTPASSATPSPTVTATRTAQPTRTPFPTIERYTTRTPTFTPTVVTPCIASVNYNLRLRAAPDADAETLTTIPYATSIMLYAQSADGVWWQTEFDGQSGWVDGQYLALSATCAALPTR